MNLLDVSDQQLIARSLILQKIIEENPFDPRVGEPKRQLRIVEEEIQRRKDEKGLVVGLKTLTIKSESRLGR